jgi:hypothetical protein
MNNEELKISIQELLSRPLITKLKDMHRGILGNLECVLKDSEDCPDPIEYARMNGMVYAFTLCRGMIEAILRLEERKCGCGSYVDEENKTSSSTCMDCRRKTLG